MLFMWRSLSYTYIGDEIVRVNYFICKLSTETWILLFALRQTHRLCLELEALWTMCASDVHVRVAQTTPILQSSGSSMNTNAIGRYYTIITYILACLKIVLTIIFKWIRFLEGNCGCLEQCRSLHAVFNHLRVRNCMHNSCN